MKVIYTVIQIALVAFALVIFFDAMVSVSGTVMNQISTIAQGMFVLILARIAQAAGHNSKD